MTIMTTLSPSTTLERKAGYYDIDGQLYPSVTTILGKTIAKPGLMNWYGKIGTEEANRIKQESADFGKTVHLLIQAVLDGKEIDETQTDKTAVGCLHSFQEWVRLVGFKPLLTEHTIHSKTHGYAGTCDAFGLVYGIPTLCDWKTSGAIYDEFSLQLHAYTAAIREMGIGDPKMQLIVRLDKKDAQCSVHAYGWDDTALNCLIS